MKVLLTTLNSKYVHGNLALKYLYTTGKPFCTGLEIREFTINNSRDYVFGELVMGDYDAVCFSCYIWNIRQTLELAQDLKKANPRLLILFGGPEVSYDWESFMARNPFVDFLITGEGEEAFAQWCCQLEGNQVWEQVAGLVFRGKGNGRILANPPGTPLDFEKIPFPYEDFPCERDKVIYYEASRGCPFNCSYCISSLDKTMWVLPLKRVKQDLSRFLKAGVKQVKFLDRTFNWDRQRSFELFSWLMDQDQGVTNFHFEICADLLDEEILRALGQARKGLFQFEIGIQSTNEKTLKAVNRTSDLEKTFAHVRRLISLGNSHIHVDLIAGLPYEDYHSFSKSFDQVYGLGADNLQLGFLKLLKGTELRKRAKDLGYVYMENAPYQVIGSDCLSPREVCQLKQVETVLDLYHNRGGFETALDWGIQSYGKGPFAFFEAFSQYFHSQGFQHRSHKKEDLYRIFYAFGCFLEQGESLKPLLETDLEATMNFDAVKKFKKKGWDIP